jgi:site-specific recombinase
MSRGVASVFPNLFARRREHHVHARLDELSEFAPDSGSTEELVFWFVRLVAWARPRSKESAVLRVRFLARHLESHGVARERVAKALTSLVECVDLQSFLAYGGIPRDFHLMGALTQWLSAHLLPAACRTDDVEQIICLALRERDLAWVRASGIVPLLCDLLPPEVVGEFGRAAADAMLDLAHQIAAQAHAPHVRKLAAASRSPYRGLYDTVAAFTASPSDAAGMKALRGRVVQCRLALGELREQLSKRGADLNTTFQLMRIRSQLERLDLLTIALHTGRSAESRVVATLSRHALHNARAKHLVARSSELVVQNLVDSTADVGDTYVDEKNSSLRASFAAGAGGGALMVIATIAKFGLGSLHLPALYEGFAFSLNYAAVFVAAYLLHYIIATKLPAHTASALARSIQGGGSRRERVRAFVCVLRALIRLQLGGLFGNLVIAGPLAYGVARAVHAATGHSLIGPEQAMHALSANSILGPSVLYAALTGVFLWVSSLVGAGVDNWARINGVGAALSTGIPVMKTIGVARAEPTAMRIEGRIGGLVGNGFLGFLLGGVPAAFALAALPVEIRHVTVSTGSVAIAIATGAGTRSEVALAITGVLAIGLVNVVVSFALALWLALRASEDTRSGWLLARVGLGRVLARGQRAAVTSCS